MTDSPEFLIDGILPANEVHLIGGSSGSGKTTFAFQVFLAAWQQGSPVFDHPSHVVPYAYISLDRSRSSVARTLQRLGLSDAITRIVCQEEVPEDALTVDVVIKEALKVYPDSELIVIEGFQLLAGEKGNGYTHVGKVLKKAARICSQKQITVIGVCHSPKMKVDERFKHARETIMGSASWGAYSDTIIVLDHDESTGIIAVNIMPRNEKSETHEMKFGERGILEPYIPGTKQDIIRNRIERLPTGRPITRVEILAWGKSSNISVRTCESAITACVENKILDSLGTGIYERTQNQPIVTKLDDEGDLDITVDE